MKLSDLFEATQRARKLTPEECDRLDRIYSGLSHYGLASRMLRKVSPLHYMNQLLLKFGVGDIYINPYFAVGGSFRVKIKFEPDVRHSKMNIGDLYDGDPEVHKKLKMRAKLTDAQITLTEVLTDIVKVCKREGATDFLAWVAGEDEVDDFEVSEADKKIEELVRVHGTGVFQIEAVW